MSWAARRRFFILLLIGLVAGAFALAVGFATFYRAPSCSDGIQNQGEAGVDCGGPCPYLCTALEQPPTVVYTTVLPGAGSGRVDVIASIENKNPTAAAKAVPYQLRLYGADHSLLQQTTGTVDLPPSATVPVFVPNLPVGAQTATQAFLTIASSAPQWYALASDPRLMPAISNTTLGGTTGAPTVTATLTNPSTAALSNIPLDVLVTNVQGNVIAASHTVVPDIPAGSSASAVFTWNQAFSSSPSAIQVVPVVPLP